MTEGIDPRLVSGASALVAWSRWGLSGSIVQLVRLGTTDVGAATVGLSQDAFADWFNTDPRYIARLCRQLVRDQVLGRNPPPGVRTGSAPIDWWILDPRGWLRVPWRFPADHQAPDRPPTAVTLRLDECVGAILKATQVPKTRYSAAKRRFETRWGTPPKEAFSWTGSAAKPDRQSRTTSAAKTSKFPSSTKSGPTGRAPVGVDVGTGEVIGAPSQAVARDGEGEERRARPAGEVVKLGPGADAVVGAMLRTGTGPVAASIRKRVAAAFGDAPVEGLRPILDTIEQLALYGQRPPKQADVAIEWFERGYHVLRGRRVSELGLDGALEQLHERRRAMLADQQAAEADGDPEAARSFTEDLARCDYEIGVVESALREAD